MKQPDKFAKGQVVRHTDEGLKKYRGGAREEMVVQRSRDGHALVKYADGTEAVYDEQYLETV